jgi:hypothetical protein
MAVMSVEEKDVDLRFLESIPIEVLHRIPAAGGTYETTKGWQVNATSFQEMARAAQGQTEQLAPKVRCVVSMASEKDAGFTKREHFVPEGLGFDWTAPPGGVGTCDDVNARFGCYEGEWLRQGKMGIFRPFFVRVGKDEPPVYFAPKKNGARFWFKRKKDGRRTLCLSPDFAHVNLPDRAGPSVLVIRVPHNEARVEWVSLALHKMALLMFWLCQGALAFDAAFADVRRFLLEPGNQTYRPFIESMVEGATPG